MSAHTRSTREASGVDAGRGGQEVAANYNEAPANPERMSEKRQNAESAKTDDADAFNLHEDLTSTRYEP